MNMCRVSRSGTLGVSLRLWMAGNHCLILPTSARQCSTQLGMSQSLTLYRCMELNHILACSNQAGVTVGSRSIVSSEALLDDDFAADAGY